MPDRCVVVDWNDQLGSHEFGRDGGDESTADVIVFGAEVDAPMIDLIKRAFIDRPQVDVIVAYEPHDTARHDSIRNKLPGWLCLLTASPAGDPAVAVRAKVLSAEAGSQLKVASAEERVLRLALCGRSVHWMEAASQSGRSPRRPPSLTVASTGGQRTWLREWLVCEPLPVANPHSREATALRAGLLLLNDFFDDSHSCSQSMEGHQHADYWHAILHRREPDYGNAKYWFRHVGRHANFEELARRVAVLFDGVSWSLAGKLERWRPRLITVGGWEPFAFVDLCQTAAADAELRSWCEQVQFTEMLLLLAASADFV